MCYALLILSYPNNRITIKTCIPSNVRNDFESRVRVEILLCCFFSPLFVATALTHIHTCSTHYTPAKIRPRGRPNRTHTHTHSTYTTIYICNLRSWRERWERITLYPLPCRPRDSGWEEMCKYQPVFTHIQCHIVTWQTRSEKFWNLSRLAEGKRERVRAVPVLWTLFVSPRMIGREMNCSAR